MPEKELSKQIVWLILAMSFVGALANALSDEELTKRNFLHFLIQVIVGGLSGIIFGFLGCWLFSEQIYAVGCISGIGAVLGIKGIREISLVLKKYIQSKFK